MPSKYTKNWARTELRLQRLIDNQENISSRSAEPTHTRDSENTPQEGRWIQVIVLHLFPKVF